MEIITNVLRYFLFAITSYPYRKSNNTYKNGHIYGNKYNSNKSKSVAQSSWSFNHNQHLENLSYDDRSGLNMLK